MRLFLIAALFFALPAVAQERTAGGTLDTQMSWTALQSSIGAVSGRVTVIETDIQAMKDCAKAGKIWKSGTGCIFPANNLDTSLYDEMVRCGDKGMVYDKSAKNCVSTSSSNWSFMKLVPYTAAETHTQFIQPKSQSQIKQMQSGAIDSHKVYGPLCTTSKMNLGVCTSVEKGKTCYTTRLASKECTGSDGPGNACNARYDGYLEVYKCI